MICKLVGNRIFKGVVALITPLSLFSQNFLSDERPNVILIMTDQQTADAMSNRGNPYVSTPAMDKLAEDGITFNNSYCSYPLSGPSRASITTGKMPSQLKVLDNDYPLSEQDRLANIGFTMKNAGYTCLYAGKWHVPTINIPDKDFGFEKVCDMYDPGMAQSIDERLSHKKDTPLFLVASYLNPHEICEYARNQTLHYGEISVPDSVLLPELPSNFDSTEGLSELLIHHKRMSPKLYPTENYSLKDWQKYLYSYYRLVERVDAHIGNLIDVLKKHDLYDKSIIIFTSDHGDGVAAHRWNQKRALFEETIKVPLIVKPQKSKKKGYGYELSGLVNIGIDLYPTICDYGEAAIPEELNGISLKKIIEKTSKPHESVFIETHLDGINGRAWCVIKGNYKYVFYRFFKNREQLFNLSKDKGETNNLIGKTSYSEVYDMMKSELLNHALKVNDTMLIKDLSF